MYGPNKLGALTVNPHSALLKHGARSKPRLILYQPLYGPQHGNGKGFAQFEHGKISLYFVVIFKVTIPIATYH